MFSCFFFFNDTATTEIYTLSLHDALPILLRRQQVDEHVLRAVGVLVLVDQHVAEAISPLLERLRVGAVQLDELHDEVVERSEEHTSELQSQSNLVCRLLLEKKKNNRANHALHVRTGRQERLHRLLPPTSGFICYLICVLLRRPVLLAVRLAPTRTNRPQSHL